MDPATDAGEERLSFEEIPVSAQDPETVCHRTIRGGQAYFPQTEFHGRILYFCTEACQNVFLSDPERFYAAHSKR